MKQKTKLEIIFSKGTETKRVRSTLDKLNWFKKQGYKINLPKKILEIIDQRRIPNDEEILDAVVLEFNQEQYISKERELREKWEEKKDEFMQKLAELGLPLQSKYRLLFTKYGVGGSYNLPNSIQINFDYHLAKDTIATTFHEIIHLTIEKLIKKYNIDHWTKERLVDLTFGRFYPNEKRLQRDPERLSEINTIFDKFFPDIKKIIIEINTFDKKRGL